MCRLLVAVIFVNITMGWGWGCYFIPMSLFTVSAIQTGVTCTELHCMIGGGGCPAPLPSSDGNSSRWNYLRVVLCGATEAH